MWVLRRLYRHRVWVSMIETTDEFGNTWMEPERPVHCYLCAFDWVPSVPEGNTVVHCPNCGYENEVDLLFDDSNDELYGAL